MKFQFVVCSDSCSNTKGKRAKKYKCIQMTNFNMSNLIINLLSHHAKVSCELRRKFSQRLFFKYLFSLKIVLLSEYFSQVSSERFLEMITIILIVRIFFRFIKEFFSSAQSLISIPHDFYFRSNLCF